MPRGLATEPIASDKDLLSLHPYVVELHDLAFGIDIINVNEAYQRVVEDAGAGTLPSNA